MNSPSDFAARSLENATVGQFRQRVEHQAAALRRAIRAGDCNNPDYALGLEIEVYGIKQPTDQDQGGELERVPPAVFEAGATKELGLHNAELNTTPDRFDADGLANQQAAIHAAFERANSAARTESRSLALDAMWTIPPTEGAVPYLSAHETHDGFVVAEHMQPDPRYCAIDNDTLTRSDGQILLDVPGATHSFPTILFESLATSIQPHIQIPTATEFPRHFNAAVRTLGPLLALATNSPFLPADLYDESVSPQSLLDETHHELRIAVFEQSVNASPSPKVRVPRDIADPTAVVDRVVADDLYAPFLREWLDDSPRESFAADHWEFDYKRTTYWRWIRCVIGGDPVAGAGDEQSLRIEYRPLPTQPTVADIVSLQALTAGLIRGLVVTDHPIPTLEWTAARDSFYRAAKSGLDAELDWITADGERTQEHDTIYADIFQTARIGLDDAGMSSGEIDNRLAPLEARIDAHTTPSAWKITRVGDHLEAGETLAEAIAGMQREYFERSQQSETFADWI